MFIAKVNDKFIATSQYKEKDILKNAGFFWDSKQRCWWTRSLTAVSQVKSYLDKDLAAEVEEAMSNQENKVEASRATNSNLVIPAPEGKDYFPFQKAGIEFISNKTNTLLADQPGLGKTIQVVGFMNLTPAIRRTRSSLGD